MNTVSVIVPLYNHRRYIRTAVESVLNQTAPPLEILVIDDGSTDKSRDAIADFIESGEIIYVRQENQGVSAARNHGISLARGEFIALLDSDDAWMPTKLEKQLAVFEKNPELALVHTRV